MTTSRVIRGTKAKIFLYVSAVLIITALMACFNNTLSQLDEIRKSNEICHQQQDNLSTQLQVISDYKQKLEKSLKNEKAEHQQSKTSLALKINEEKSKSEKKSNDALLKYNSLQQHFNLLQTQYDDFKEESSATQKKQLNEINSLQSKLKEIEEELKKVKASKESIKTQYTELELENQKLKNALNTKALDNEAQKAINFYAEKYHTLEDKYKGLQAKCGIENQQDSPQFPNASQVNKPSEKSLLNLPGFKMAEKPSSSTKSGPKVSPSQGNINAARPLSQPSVTPETAKKEVNLKPPQGVPAVPETRENQNEQPEVEFPKKIERDLVEDNAAHEVFDAPQKDAIDGGLAFNDEVQGQHLDKKHVDSLAVPENKKRVEPDYKDMAHEEEGDDDIDDYIGNQARQAEPAVRN